MLDAPEDDREVTRCGAIALWSLAKSTKNKEVCDAYLNFYNHIYLPADISLIVLKKAIRRAGAIPLLAKLVIRDDVSLVVPVVGILQECASDPTFRTAIRTEGLLGHFVKSLSSDSADLVQFSAKAIFMVYYFPHRTINKSSLKSLSF